MIKEFIKKKFDEWERIDKDNANFKKELNEAEKKAFRESLLDEKIKTAKIKAKILAGRDLKDFDKKAVKKKTIFDKSLNMDDIEKYIIGGDIK
jgi:hypothetical protein